MTDRAVWVPKDVDITVPSPARMYDYLLGGGHNFTVDRTMIDKILTFMPTIGQVALCNRAFLRRAVLTLVEAGVRQFLDIGSGIPTAGNVHEIAQRAAPDARVVYVDIDPVAVAHSELVLTDNNRASAILADMRNPTSILQHPTTQQLLDFNAPIGLLMVTIFHYVADTENPLKLMAHYRDALAEGSYLVISHGTADFHPAKVAGVVELMKKSISFHPRTRAEITELFTGFDLIDPGLVTTSQWRPHLAEDGADLGHEDTYAGVGIKRTNRQSPSR